MDYHEFLESKAVRAPMRGLAKLPELPAHLKPHQAYGLAAGLRIGSWGCFYDTGLGKSAIELAFAQLALEASNGRALLMTPLAVARQMAGEAERWGHEARVIREQGDARSGINICNYDRLDKLDPEAFDVIVLDESSILKNFSGKMSRALIAAFRSHRWRMASGATPAPNDHMELGMQSEFLGLMPQVDMLQRWFINDSADTGSWRMKGHAVTDFWDWMASWAVMAEHPRDLGFETPGYDLPPLNVIRHHAEEGAVVVPGSLFADANVSATSLHDVKRQTIGMRAALAGEVVMREPGEPWVIWCDTDYESDALRKALPGAVEVKGSHSIDVKEETLAAFASGEARWLITKPSITGHGLNWQHAARMLFVGRSFSYESWYQAVRRCWRFGQLRPVDCHLIVAAGEDSIGRVIDRKADDHDQMKAEMSAAMRRAIGRSREKRVTYNPTHEGRLPTWL